MNSVQMKLEKYQSRNKENNRLQFKQDLPASESSQNEQLRGGAGQEKETNFLGYDSGVQLKLLDFNS